MRGSAKKHGPGHIYAFGSALDSHFGWPDGFAVVRRDLQSFRKICSRWDEFAVVQRDLRSFRKICSRSANFVGTQDHNHPTRNALKEARQKKLPREKTAAEKFCSGFLINPFIADAPHRQEMLINRKAGLTDFLADVADM